MNDVYSVKWLVFTDDGVFIGECPHGKTRLHECLKCGSMVSYLSGNVKLWCSEQKKKAEGFNPITFI